MTKWLCYSIFLALDSDSFLAINEIPVGALSFRHFPYNENPMRALNTNSLKCCLPSTGTIDRREKSHVCVWWFKVASWMRASLKSTSFLPVFLHWFAPKCHVVSSFFKNIYPWLHGQQDNPVNRYSTSLEHQLCRESSFYIKEI